MKDNCLFIGGVHDGKWEKVPFNQQYYEIAISPKKLLEVCTEDFEMNEGLPLTITIEREIYKKDTVKTFSRTFYVMVLTDMSTNDWTGMLLQGYKQPKKTTGL